jgi:hypothetical protein
VVLHRHADGLGAGDESVVEEDRHRPVGAAVHGEQRRLAVLELGRLGGHVEEDAAPTGRRRS